MKMVQIPEGQALAAVMDNGTPGQPCKGCFFEAEMREVNYEKERSICRYIACAGLERPDKKDVIFVLKVSP